ncbi:hypothetical protein Pla110_04530 [Polystyrenella longa]|uniref:Rho termination factor N-terminal domain-containing protein n=2 Tax=Polystyrenella longa TaxID=2528007 RepID=A0A518CHP1_9PLAN|nr:hypothetical protein Pla110_04530 [Polystyrenella longa]
MLEELREHSRKELAQMAKTHRIRGWHLLKKEELIERLMNAGNIDDELQAREKSTDSSATSNRSGVKLIRHDPGRETGKRALSLRASESQVLTAQAETDELEIELLSSHWFRLRWALSPRTLERAEVSLAAAWSTVKPVLRLFQVDLEPAGTSQESQIDQVEISDRFREWYFPVPEPERRFRVKLGLLTVDGRFYQLACSESVDTPREVSRSAIVDGLAEVETGEEDGGSEELNDLKSIAQLIQGRSSHPRTVAATGVFEVELEWTLKGTGDPRGVVTILGEPVELDRNGAFEVSMPFAPGREVIPVVETTDEGRKKQTVVLTVELNRRKLEPQILGMRPDLDDEDE